MRAEELKGLLQRGEDLVVINVLSEGAFEAEHIPGSLNVPYAPDLVDQVQKLAGRKDRPIVVYCSNKLCSASPLAAHKLEQNGFTNVIHFEGGLAEWKLAGFAIDSGAAAPG